MGVTNYLRGIELNRLPPESSYLHDLPLIKQLAKNGGLYFERAVTFIVGENGTGKSTLLEAIAAAMGFNPEGGGRNFTFSTNATHSELWEYIDTLKTVAPDDGYFLRAESLYNLASNIDEMTSSDPLFINCYGGISLHRQSHGESFLSLIRNRLGGGGLYIFDEPESALSPMRLLTLITEIDRLAKAESQLIIATHSPILMAYPSAEIIELKEDGIRKTSYKETEHYKITKQFLDDPERILRHLLG